MDAGWMLLLPLSISIVLLVLWVQRHSRAPLAWSKRQQGLCRRLAGLKSSWCRGSSWPQEPLMDLRGVQRSPPVSESCNGLGFSGSSQDVGSEDVELSFYPTSASMCWEREEAGLDSICISCGGEEPFLL